MSYTPRSLFRLLEDVDASRLLLPHIQRPFVWDREQMARLFDSLMREYPIQTFLFWRTKEEIRARRFMPLVDFDPDLSDYYDLGKSAAGVEKTFVLDGQQRLQTLHAIFRGGIKSDDGDVAEAYFSVTDGSGLEGDEVQYSLQFSTTPLAAPYFRIRDLSDRYANENPMNVADELSDSLGTPSDDGGVRRQRERQIRGNLQQLHSILHHDKHFWVDELDGIARSFPYRRVLEIFVRVNSGGTKLTAGDLMFAAMKEGWDDIEQRVEDTVDLLNGGRLALDSDFVLKCLLLAQGEGAEVRTEKFWGAKGEDLMRRVEANWDAAEAAFQQLRDFMVQNLRLHSDRIVRSYNALIPLFDYLYRHPKPDERDRRLMAAYFHKAQLFGWFSQQGDATLNMMHSIIVGAGDASFPLRAVKEYFVRSRNAQTSVTDGLLDDKRLRPLLLNIVYSVSWGNSPFDVAYKGNEPHVDHIYPQHMLKTKLKLSSGAVNDIGNLRFFGASDNIRKRAELPAAYFGRLKDAKVPIEKHLLLPEFAKNPRVAMAFDADTYDRFRSQRRIAILSALREVVDPEIEVGQPSA